MEGLKKDGKDRPRGKGSGSLTRDGKAGRVIGRGGKRERVREVAGGRTGGRKGGWRNWRSDRK